MKTQVKTNYLISEVRACIKVPYSNWYVGISDRDNVWRKYKGEMIVFNVLDSDATVAAYEYFVNAGMMGKKPIGNTPRYLYMYSTDGILPDGFIH